MLLLLFYLFSKMVSSLHLKKTYSIYYIFVFPHSPVLNFYKLLWLSVMLFLILILFLIYTHQPL